MYSIAVLSLTCLLTFSLNLNAEVKKKSKKSVSKKPPVVKKVPTPEISKELTLPTTSPEAVVTPVEPKTEQVARDASGSNLSVGLQLGGSTAKLSQTGTDFSSRGGFTAGLLADYSIDQMFSVQPEVNFIQKGGVFTATSGEQTYKLDTIEVPVLAKAKFDVSVVKPFVFLGPVLGFTIGNKMAATGGSEVAVATKGIEFGGIGGVGAETKIADEWNLNASARYSMGFTDLFQTTGANAKSRQFVFLIGVAYTNLNI